jgi:hypothetical protein
LTPDGSILIEELRLVNRKIKIPFNRIVVVVVVVVLILVLVVFVVLVLRISQVFGTSEDRPCTKNVVAKLLFKKLRLNMQNIWLAQLCM